MQNNSKFTGVLLDYGHGGILNGEYQTPGKRSPEYDTGVLFEGFCNRQIGAKLESKLQNAGIPYAVICDWQQDTSLDTRTARADLYDNGEMFLLSLHSNAGGGEGSEFLHFPGSEEGEAIAKMFSNCYSRVFRTQKNRGLKPRNDLAILRDTKMPSVLVENFFMDNESECVEILQSEEGREKIATYLFDAIELITFDMPF